MKQQLLLLKDVDALGKKGEIVSAKPGYVRNFLIPKGYAIVANTHTLRKQERLKQERREQAIIDRKESEELVAKLHDLILETKVKVDPEGHMYGSVSPNDILKLFEEKGVAMERKYILLTKPIKETGTHTIALRLKEGVETSCKLSIIPEGVEMKGLEAVIKPIHEESQSQEASTDEKSE